jgi:hypothetical protein
MTCNVAGGLIPLLEPAVRIRLFALVVALLLYERDAMELYRTKSVIRAHFRRGAARMPVPSPGSLYDILICQDSSQMILDSSQTR